MKKSLSILALLLGFLLVAIQSFAQAPVVSNKKTAIPENQVQVQQKGNRMIRSVSVTSLKKGTNYLTLNSGDILYVEVQNKKISRFTLTSKTGVVLGNIVITGGATEFQCSSRFCMCRGDADCNDMFTTNVCGPDAVCFGETCVCYR